jgi:YggT family protein
MTIAQSLIVFFIIPALKIFMWLIIARIIISWLVAFNVVNLRNPLMRQIYNMLDAITEPVMAPVRRLIPAVGGLDLSPILIFFVIQWLTWFIGTRVYTLLG